MNNLKKARRSRMGNLLAPGKIQRLPGVRGNSKDMDYETYNNMYGSKKKD